MTKEQQSPKQKRQTEKGRHLILLNDDLNTFEHVIGCLVSICDHTEIQAEQCAFITHHKGKCGIKSGSYDGLRPFFQDLRSQGLFVIIS